MYSADLILIKDVYARAWLQTIHELLSTEVQMKTTKSSSLWL